MIGNQYPRIRIEPDRVATDGAGAAMLMDEYGVHLDEWQRLVLDCWLGKDATGKYNVTSGGLSVSRQNGKNVIIEAREFYGLLVNGERILHTGHQARTSKKAFRRLAAMFSDETHPEIMEMVKKIRYGVGEEAIELTNGGIIEFTSRSRQAARGYDGISLVVFDECQELTDEMLEAIMATLSASTTGTRQLLYVGTPPYLGCPDVFRRFREACIHQQERNVDTHNSWHEWSVAGDSIKDIDISNKKLWYECNPALGTRLTEEFTAAEMQTMDAAGFARERLGWYAPQIAVEKAQTAIDAALWDSNASTEQKPEGKTAYGIKFSADGTEVVLAGAVLPKDGKGRISLIERRPAGDGLAWLADWLNTRYDKASCVVIDGKGGADVLIDKIAKVWRFKDSIIKANAQTVTTAASMLINDLAEHNITWYKAQEMLRDSAITATKRSIAGGYGFGGADSAPIEACALALYGCRTSKRNPQRKMRIG